jgi:hypothetical protein
MSSDQPIQNLDQIDIVGKRNDGGVDLIVVVSAPLLDSQAHKDLLREKVKMYAREIQAPQFRLDLRLMESSPIQILVVSDQYVDGPMRDFVLSLAPIAEEAGATLRLTTSKEQWQ